jgi:RNA polymerase sigma factor (sigma-70 family)
MSAVRMIPARHYTDRTVAIAQIARDAAAGDSRAWTELVDLMDGVLRRLAQSYRLPAADVDDVVQTTWLRALEHIERLDAHEAAAGWLIVIARREAMRVLQRGVREILTDSLPEPCETAYASPHDAVMRQEVRNLVRGAVSRLPGRQQRLIASILHTPTMSYAQRSSQLGMPVGAIGPTRGRALGRLRRDRELQMLASAADRRRCA